MLSVTKRCTGFLFAVAMILFFLAGVAAYANSACELTLPPVPVTMTVDVNEYKACNDLATFSSYFIGTFSKVGAGYSIGDGPYTGFCAELVGSILDYSLFVNPQYQVQFYLSTDTSLPLTLKQVQDPITGNTYTIPWDKINYVLNHYPVSANSWLDVQAAIWSLVEDCNLSNQTGPLFDCPPVRSNPYYFPYGTTSSGPYGCQPNGIVNVANVKSMVAYAAAHGGGFTPGPGDLVAIVVDVKSCSVSPYCDVYLPYQILFIPVHCPDTGKLLVEEISLNPNPSPVNTPIVLTATLDDSATGHSNIASAQYSLDYGINWYPMLAQDGAFDSPTEKVTATIGSPSTPGLYEVCVRGTDVAGNIGDKLCIVWPVYDPNGNYVMGAGIITSPPGAYTPNLSLTGKAVFAFYSRYEKGKNVPTGLTDFYFKAGNFNFYSNSYEWLVVTGHKARYKGTGKINGTGNYGFILAAIDGQKAGGGGVDKFRIKIWDKTTRAIIYDNKMDAPDDDDPTTKVDSGFIIIAK